MFVDPPQSRFPFLNNSFQGAERCTANTYPQDKQRADLLAKLAPAISRESLRDVQDYTQIVSMQTQTQSIQTQMWNAHCLVQTSVQDCTWTQTHEALMKLQSGCCKCPSVLSAIIQSLPISSASKVDFCFYGAERRRRWEAASIPEG